MAPAASGSAASARLGAISTAQHSALDIVLLGGSYRSRSNTLEGPLAIEAVSTFHASRFILGADGVSLEEGVTTPSIGLAGVERAMVRQTRGEIMVLADASKFGVIGDVAICRLDKVDAIIVDDAVDKDVRDEMERLGISQVVV